MASFEYVMARWMRSRRLTVASVGARRGCGALRPRPLPRQGGGSGLGTFCLVVGAWVGAVGGGGLAPLRLELPGVLGASVGLVLGAE